MVKICKNLFIFGYFLTTNFICSQRIYINSIQKCGTHLCKRAIELLTDRKVENTGRDLVTLNKLPKLTPNSILLWHVPYSQIANKVFEENNFICLFIYRDPRDCLISTAHWSLKYRHLLIGLDVNINGQLDFSELLKKFMPRINEIYLDFIGWLNKPYVLGVKFEDLVGPKGGGDKNKQYQTIIKICKHIKVKHDNSRIENCTKKIFGGTGTFREGKIGSWKKYFKNEHKEAFKRIAGDLLIKLGYEKDNNW